MAFPTRRSKELPGLRPKPALAPMRGAQMVTISGMRPDLVRPRRIVLRSGGEQVQPLQVFRPVRIGLGARPASTSRPARSTRLWSASFTGASSSTAPTTLS